MRLSRFDRPTPGGTDHVINQTTTEHRVGAPASPIEAIAATPVAA
jgi:hypothetical protein